MAIPNERNNNKTVKQEKREKEKTTTTHSLTHLQRSTFTILYRHIHTDEGIHCMSFSYSLAMRILYKSIWQWIVVNKSQKSKMYAECQANKPKL